jgi:3-hydroxyisobutyrate dehydrogenase
MTNVGVIGLGRMGTAMAGRFSSQGWTVHAFTRSGIPDQRARELSLIPHATPAGVAANADLVFLSLFDDAAVAEIVEALLQADIAGRLIVDTSTVRPAVLRELLPRIEAAGASAIDAPISGGPEMIASGSCGIFIGGTAENAGRAMPALEVLSNRIHHVGPLGSGLAMKVVNNTMLQGYWATLTEAVRIARKSGLPLELALSILSGGPAANPMFKSRVPRILGEDRDVGFSVAAAAKDSAVFVATAQDFGVDVPVLRLARKMFEGAAEAGLGEADIAAVIADAYDRA